MNRSNIVTEALKIAKTSKKLSKALDVSLRTIQRWIAGDALPSGESLAKLYDYLIKYSK